MTVSPQLEKYSKQVARKHHLAFSVLGDPGNEVAATFGLRFQLPEDLRQLYQKFGIDFERFYGEDTGTLPLPARFILDGQGTIQQAEVHPDYTKRPEPTDIPKIISSLQ